MARKLRYQLENVCYHVVTRIAHREFMFDDEEKGIVIDFVRGVERFTGVKVLAYVVMSNHLHLLLFIEKPATLAAWEDAGYFLGYDFDYFKEGDVYKVSKLNTFTQQEVDEFRRLADLPILDRYELTHDELLARMRAMMRPAAFDRLMEQWAKLRPDELEEEYVRQCFRMYGLSVFMKILKQNISQYYNARHKHHKHAGAMWEGRFKDSILERSIDAMSSVSTYINLNSWCAEMVANPADYKWGSWRAALEGDETRRAGYNFIYDISSQWETVAEVHRQQLEHRMAKDTAEQAEKEEAVFTSGTIIGTESFIRKIVTREEEAFTTGHKTPPVDFGVGGVTLKTLRNIGILR